MATSKKPTRRPAKAAPVKPSQTELFDQLTDDSTQDARNLLPQKGLDSEILGIYRQALKHRDHLVKFYITYTTIFTCIIVYFLGLQAYARVVTDDPAIQLIPSDALNLLVVGMFGQFIGLLTIVTTKVWSYDKFPKYGQGK